MSHSDSLDGALALGHRVRQIPQAAKAVGTDAGGTGLGVSQPPQLPRGLETRETRSPGQVICMCMRPVAVGAGPSALESRVLALAPIPIVHQVDSLLRDHRSVHASLDFELLERRHPATRALPDVSANQEEVVPEAPIDDHVVVSIGHHLNCSGRGALVARWQRIEASAPVLAIMLLEHWKREVVRRAQRRIGHRDRVFGACQCRGSGTSAACGL